MRHTLAVTGSGTPQAPGRTPHKAPQAPLRCPGGEDTPPEASEAPASEAMMLKGALPAAGRARVSQAAPEPSGRAGAGGRHARR